MTLMREDVTSLYEQIAATLQEEIERGAYEPSGKLPSEAELGDRFAVSRVTVRLALARLTDAQVVERKQGKGTFAKRRRLQHRLDELRGFYDSLAAQGARASMELLRIETCEVPPGLRETFTADVTRCLYLERLHRVDDAPVALAQTCMLLEADTLSRKDVAALPSYEMLERFGWHVVDAEMSVTAVGAESDIAAYLDVRAGAPLLVLRRTSRLADGRACEATVFHIRPERFDLLVHSGLEARLVD
jgi:GntR family transcriptional regulator